MPNNDFKILIQAIIDAKDVQTRLNAMKDLSVKINNLNLDKSVIDSLRNQLSKNGIDLNLALGNINQVQEQAAKTGKQIGKQISDNVEKAINNIDTGINISEANTEKVRDTLLANMDSYKSVHNALLSPDIKSASIQAKTLGGLFKENADKFSNWLFAGSVTSEGLRSIKEAVAELKQVDNILVEISQTSDMTESQLKNLGITAFDSASELGKKATDYLTAIREMSRSGYRGPQAEDMANVSLLAQAAGGVDADLANQYILATNAAYKFQGEASKLNTVLDGQNMITNRNSVSLADMASAMSESGTVASRYHIPIEEFSAMIGTIESVTKIGGKETGTGIKSILTNLQNIASSKISDTLNEANASMTKFVNGTVQLRDPVSILRDLSAAFNALDESDPMREKILTDIGGKDQANTLAALLQNMDLFDKMLEDYSEGAGSAVADAKKAAESWSGVINKVSNSWTSLIQNFVNRDAVIDTFEVIDSLIQKLDQFQNLIGTSGTLGLGAGLFASIKNVGRHKMFCLKLNMPTFICVLLDTRVFI